MTNSVDGQTPLSLKDVLVKYIQYYDQVWSVGNLKVCSETQVADEARRILSSDEELRKRFTTLDIYQTLYVCVQYRDCQRHIQGFIKAVKLLEMFCVNLFMFPWKKEIKSLKTFTGHFVYYIKPVLPFAKSILQSIGYCIETDTEYRLSDNFDTDKAKRMGFDLFLARLECEYLLELMSQRTHEECLEILRNRAASLNFNAGNYVSVQINDTCNLNEEVFKDNEHVEGGSLVNPGENPNMGLDKSQDSTISDTDRPSSSFMTDDKSILEMQENYPDLAIRQKPIFQKPQTATHHPLKAKELDGCKGHNVAIIHEVSTDMSGPQSINMHTETAMGNKQLHIPNAGVETQPLDDKSLVLRVRTPLEGHKCEGSSEDLLVELTEQMGKLHMKETNADESLKYPIEETAQAQPCSGNTDLSTAPPTKSPDAMGFHILSNPSQEPVCNITGCDRFVGYDVLTQDNTIKEPPQSIYVPNSLSGCTLALGPPTDDNQTTNDGSSVQLHRSPTSRHPEDDLLQTYVMV